MKEPHPYRIRVRTTDGKPREPNQLKGKLFPYVDVLDAGSKLEFILCAPVEKHLAGIREKLASAGLEEMPEGATDLPAGGETAARKGTPHAGRGRPASRQQNHARPPHQNQP